MGSFKLNVQEFLPYIKLNCKEGIVERSTFDGNERSTEIVDNLVALIDFVTLTTGWIRYDGEAPDMRLVALGDPLPDRPGSDYKQGIKLIAMLPKDLGLHELSTTATAAITALESIYDEAVAAPEWAKEQVPIVQLVDWTREKTKHGSRAVPNFKIVGWKERPEAFLKYKAIPKERAAMPAGKVANQTNPGATATESVKSASVNPTAMAQLKADPEAFDPDNFG